MIPHFLQEKMNKHFKIFGLHFQFYLRGVIFAQKCQKSGGFLVNQFFPSFSWSISIAGKVGSNFLTPLCNVLI